MKDVYSLVDHHHSSSPPWLQVTNYPGEKNFSHRVKFSLWGSKTHSEIGDQNGNQALLLKVS